MTELFILIAFAFGYGAHYLASKQANSVLQTTLQSMIDAWNARFVGRVKESPVVTDAPKPPVNGDSPPAPPVKNLNQPPNLRELRRQAEETIERNKVQASINTTHIP